MKKIKMKNKKAIKFLGEHTVNIIIALVILILIIYAGNKAYGLTRDSNQLEKAEANLNNFVIDFNSFMNNADKTEKEFMILGPQDWYVLFYEKQGYVPKGCEKYDYCACFCVGDSVGECNSQGICSELKYKWNWEQSYELDEVPYTIKITK